MNDTTRQAKHMFITEEQGVPLNTAARIEATRAKDAEIEAAYHRGINDGVTEIEKTLHRILRTEWKPSNFQDPTAPTVMQMIGTLEARATKAEAELEVAYKKGWHDAWDKARGTNADMCRSAGEAYRLIVQELRKGEESAALRTAPTTGEAG